LVLKSAYEWLVLKRPVRVRAFAMTGKRRIDFAFAAFIAIMLVWNICQFYYINKPHRGWLDAAISQQIGRTARHHLVLGLATTKGASVTCVKHDGTLWLHSSYSPLASWTVAMPMALGLPFRESTKMVAIASMNLFFMAFWYVLRQNGDPYAASLGVAFAAFFPATPMQYGQACIFEILGLGPTFCALALFSQPQRTPGIWVAIAVASILGVLYSWFDLIIVVPCLVREILVGNHRRRLIIGALILVVPIGLHFATLVLASGSTQSIREMFTHALERAGPGGSHGEVIPYTKVVSGTVYRWKTLLGTLAFAATVLWLVHQFIQWRKTTEGFTTAVLLAYGLPLNFIMRNASLYHEFFVVMFAPLSALALARVAWIILRSTGAREGRLLLGMALVFLCFLVYDVIPFRYLARFSEGDIWRAAIGDAIARDIRPGDFVIAGPSFFFQPTLPNGSRFPEEEREMIPHPVWFGRMVQSAFIAYDAADVARIKKWARPDQRIVLLLQGDEILDIAQDGFRPIPTGIKGFVIGVQEAKRIAGQRIVVPFLRARKDKEPTYKG
jgi:hypothetical protein